MVGWKDGWLTGRMDVKNDEWLDSSMNRKLDISMTR